METKIMQKKGKKRSLSETSVSKVKLNKKKKNVNEFNNNSPKRAKIADSKQNGNPTLTGRTQIFKIVDKQKKEQSKIVEQSNIVKSEMKKDTKETAKLTIVKPKNEIIGKSSSRSRKRRPYSTITLTAEQITKKITEIKSREVLSKRAHRILGILNRKLREIINESETLDTVGKKNIKIEHCANALMKNKQKVNDETKVKVEKKRVQSKSKPQEEDENDSDIEEDEDKDNDSDIEEESDEDESDESKAENEFVDNKKPEIDNESDIDEETEEDEEIEEEDERDVEDEEDVEDEDDVDDEEDEEEDDDDEEDEEDEDEENIIKKTRISEVRRKDVQNKSKQVPKSLDNQKKGEGKKKSYVLFVGNLPRNITEDEIKRHFLTKVDTITSIRIPTKSDKTPYDFALVEMTNNIDFEKGLSLNHTFLKKKRIIVQNSTQYAMNSKKGRLY